MDKTEQQKRQEFFDLITNYQYIREDGRLILEPFCVYLSHCFGFDGILNISPQPREIYMLLIALIRERLGDEEARRKIQMQNIADWRPEMAYIYPERKMTCIHIAALVLVSHDWIYEIGHTLMGIPEPEEPEKYFAWVQEEWLAVHAFINGYHNAFHQFQKKFDKEGIASDGYSLFEALHVSLMKRISFEDAVTQLRARHDAYQAALRQIEKAVQAGFFLEAIVLEECLISNCLFNFLDNNGVRLASPSFHTLLKRLAEKRASAHVFPGDLLRELDSWREARNTSVHGFISASSTQFDQSRVSFSELSQITALQGAEHCKSVVSWYELECVNFIRHEFPTKRHATIH